MLCLRLKVIGQSCRGTKNQMWEVTREMDFPSPASTRIYSSLHSTEIIASSVMGSFTPLPHLLPLLRQLQCPPCVILPGLFFPSALPRDPTNKSVSPIAGTGGMVIGAGLTISLLDAKIFIFLLRVLFNRSSYQRQALRRPLYHIAPQTWTFLSVCRKYSVIHVVRSNHRGLRSQPQRRNCQCS